MTDQELRNLVREAVARHLGVAPIVRSADHAQTHPSHGAFRVASGGEGEGVCLIEPTVRCNHCEYCQSYGH